jgi:hypothetical protein
MVSRTSRPAALAATSSRSVAFITNFKNLASARDRGVFGLPITYNALSRSRSNSNVNVPCLGAERLKSFGREGPISAAALAVGVTGAAGVGAKFSPSNTLPSRLVPYPANDYVKDARNHI